MSLFGYHNLSSSLCVIVQFVLCVALQLSSRSLTDLCVTAQIVFCISFRFDVISIALFVFSISLLKLACISLSVFVSSPRLYLSRMSLLVYVWSSKFGSFLALLTAFYWSLCHCSNCFMHLFWLMCNLHGSVYLLCIAAWILLCISSSFWVIFTALRILYFSLGSCVIFTGRFLLFVFSSFCMIFMIRQNSPDVLYPYTPCT